MPYRGCRLSIPALEAIAPVMKGSTAEPAAPRGPRLSQLMACTIIPGVTQPVPAIQPIDPVKRYPGRIRLAWFIAIGKKGPNRNPTSDTAIAPPTSEGTSHTTSSRLEDGQYTATRVQS